MLFIKSKSENSRTCHETVKFWAAKVTEIIKILCFFEALMSAKSFAKFHCFNNQKTPNKSKYSCQKQEKVELENSLQIQ